MSGLLLMILVGGGGIMDRDSIIALPQPDTIGKVTVEKALLHRRSIRSFASSALTIEEVGQLLWAAQGKTGRTYGRTAPSAGATYPMEVFLVAGKVNGLNPGIYHYRYEHHALSLIQEGDFRNKLAFAAFGQIWVSSAPAVLVLACEYQRTTGRYGERGIRYVHIEAGHIGQNVALQAVALNLGSVMVGAFNDGAVQRLLQTNLTPLYMIPIGKPKK